MTEAPKASPKATAIGCGVVLLLVLAVSMCTVLLPDKTAERAEVDHCQNVGGAYDASKEAVTERLRAPATAKFPDLLWDDGARVTPMPGCQFLVVSYVDAQNGFGATIRSHYTARLETTPDGRTYRLLSLDGL